MEDALTCSRQKFLFDGVPREQQTLANLTQLQQRQCLVAQLSAQLESAKQDFWDFKNSLSFEDCAYLPDMRRLSKRCSLDSLQIFHDDGVDDVKGEFDNKENTSPVKTTADILKDLTSSYNFTPLVRDCDKSPSDTAVNYLFSSRQIQRGSPQEDARVLRSVEDPVLYTPENVQDIVVDENSLLFHPDSQSPTLHRNSVEILDVDSKVPDKKISHIHSVSNDTVRSISRGTTFVLSPKFRAVSRKPSRKHNGNAKLLAQLPAVKKGEVLLRMSPKSPKKKATPKRHHQWTPRTSPLRHTAPLDESTQSRKSDDNNDQEPMTSRRLFSTNSPLEDGQCPATLQEDPDYEYRSTAIEDSDIQEQHKLYRLLDEITTELDSSESAEHYNEVSPDSSPVDRSQARSNSPEFLLHNDVSPSAYMSKLSSEEPYPQDPDNVAKNESASPGIITTEQQTKREPSLIPLDGGTDEDCLHGNSPPNDPLKGLHSTTQDASHKADNPFTEFRDQNTYSHECEENTNPFLTPVKSSDTTASLVSASDTDISCPSKISPDSFVNDSEFSTLSLMNKRKSLRRVDSLELTLKEGPCRSAVLKSTTTHARMSSYAIDDEHNVFRLKSPSGDERQTRDESPSLKASVRPIGSIRRGLNRLKSMLQVKSQSRLVGAPSIPTPTTTHLADSDVEHKSDGEASPKHTSRIPRAKWNTNEMMERGESHVKYKRISIQPWPRQRSKYIKYQSK